MMLKHLGMLCYMSEGEGSGVGVGPIGDRGVVCIHKKINYYTILCLQVHV